MRNGLVAILLLSCFGAAHTDGSKDRDGAWLKHGIEQFERFVEHDREQSPPHITEGFVALYYIAGIVDTERGHTLVANLVMSRAAENQQKDHYDMVNGVHAVARLLGTRFYDDNPPPDRVILMVRDYIAKHPEMLKKTALEVVERTLWDAYPSDLGR